MSYLGVAGPLLVLPFVTCRVGGVGDNRHAHHCAPSLVFVLALYSSVVLGKADLHQVRQILVLSLGVAFVALSVGYFLNVFAQTGGFLVSHRAPGIRHI